MKQFVAIIIAHFFLFIKLFQNISCKKVESFCDNSLYPFKSVKIHEKIENVWRKYCFLADMYAIIAISMGISIIKPDAILLIVLQSLAVVCGEKL